MMRYIAFLALIVTLCSAEGNAQEAVSFKYFSSFKGLVTGVDFFASKQKAVTPYVEPIAETIARLQALLGTDLPKGAIFICSTVEQKDSVYEPKVLKSGYGWTLTATTPEVRMQEMMDRMKSQFEGEIPAEFKTRLNNLSPEMMAEAETQMVDSIKNQISYAVVWALFAPDSRYRSSRLDDVGKSPLPDWMDIGIATYANSSTIDRAFLREHMDQTFSLEDILLMSRPFVASSFNQGSGGSFRGGGGGMPGGMSGGGGDMPRFSRGSGGGQSGGMSGFPSGFGSRGSGSFGGSSGQRGGRERVLPKDEQDRMLFDAQSGTFFLYLIDKVGVEKVKMLIKEVEAGGESLEEVTKPDLLGSDLDKIELDWVNWVQAMDSQKS